MSAEGIDGRDASTAAGSGAGQPAPVPEDGWASRALDIAGGLFAAAIVVVVLTQVVSRLRNVPVAWSEEMTRALFLWMIFIGVASSMRHADAARVTVLMGASAFLRRLALPVYLAGCLTFFVLMAWTGVAMVRQQVMMNETIATLAIPSWFIGIVMPLSALIAIIGTLASLRDHRGAIALDPESSP